AGLVTVEGEDHLAQELVVVEHEPAQDLRVVLTERGAARRHRGGDTGEVTGHHVGVALDDDSLGASGALPTSQVDPVQHLALAVDRRLGSVEVLGFDPVVVEEPARPETDDGTGQVPDRPHQPATEAVVASANTGRHQTAGNELLVAETATTQV